MRTPASVAMVVPVNDRPLVALFETPNASMTLPFKDTLEPDVAPVTNEEIVAGSSILAVTVPVPEI